jgi:phosphoserine aminotransferase
MSVSLPFDYELTTVTEKNDAVNTPSVLTVYIGDNHMVIEHGTETPIVLHNVLGI